MQDIITGLATITDDEFSKFRKLIYQIAGVTLADSKKNLVVSRLAKRLKHHNLSTFNEYYALLESGRHPDERQIMVDFLTTHETYFFREKAHFDFLKQYLQAHRKPGQSFKVWSAASSSGEEVYTIAMVLADVLGEGPWEVLGSDISRRELDTAQAALYPLERAKGIPDDYMTRFCLKGVRTQEGSFIIDKKVRSRVRFQQVNLNSSSFPKVGEFDMVFLRNVMIYFDLETKRRVVANISNNIKPGGYLIIGHSESLNGISSTLLPERPTIYRKP